MKGERRLGYLVTYAGGLAVWVVALYLVLHSWLNLSRLVVVSTILAVVGLLTLSFSIVFFTVTRPSPEERFVVRAKYHLWALLTLELIAAAILAWTIRGPGWRGWLLSASAFVVAASVCGIASWIGYRDAVRRILRKRFGRTCNVAHL